jgi:glycosyltransferase involved in cell wall biosynthesis
MNSTNIQVSFAICTFNRADFLPICIHSILSQIEEQFIFEILVIDNNSTDNTFNIVNSFITDSHIVRLVHEPKQGLSHARNRAYKEAKTDWIVYVDDDAKLKKGYCKKLLKLIKEYNFDCFGGLYTAWYLTEKPPWLSEKFGNKKPLRSDIGLIDGSTEWLSGGNFAIKKTVLEAIGGFNPELGMTGNNIGYGEEDYLQQQLFKEGYKIGFDPELVIEHAVLPHKLKLIWHLKSSFKQGVAREQIRNRKRNIIILIFELVKTVGGLFVKRLPKGIWYLFVKKEYYWQNLVLDSFNPVYRSLGSFYHKIHLKKEST